MAFSSSSSYDVALNHNDANSSSSLLSSSISSLSNPSSRHPSPVSKTYRQASTLFLTRRLPEAISTLLPIISPPDTATTAAASSKQPGEPAPVAGSSRTTRVKVWSLYLTILNAIVELGAEEGKEAFGNQEWRALCAKVRDGVVWQEVVDHGYHASEGDVDADVVINLATLMLAHARDQTLTQKRLESYLASSDAPKLDFPDNNNNNKPNGSSRRLRSPAKTGGASTPRDLNSRIKILELYTLHVLLRNNEWDYAREFISMSPVLDEERREAFLQALESLWEEKQEHDRLEQEERQRQEEQLQKSIAESKRKRAEEEERERQQQQQQQETQQQQQQKQEREEQRSGGSSISEIDYGIERDPAGRRQSPPSPQKSRPSNSRPKRKAVSSPGVAGRAGLIITRLGSLMQGLAASLGRNPLLVTKLIAFICGIVFMLGHKTTRERVRRILGSSWAKLQTTIGMGTKVSYI